MASTENEIRAWLLAYAWSGNADEKARTVDCIMAQDDWKYIDGQSEMYAAQASEPGPDSWALAHEFALSSLYECHDGPHIEGCPDLVRS